MTEARVVHVEPRGSKSPPESRRILWILHCQHMRKDAFVLERFQHRRDGGIRGPTNTCRTLWNVMNGRCVAAKGPSTRIISPMEENGAAPGEVVIRESRKRAGGKTAQRATGRENGGWSNPGMKCLYNVLVVI